MVIMWALFCAPSAWKHAGWHWRELTSAFFVPDTECRGVCVWSEHPVRRRSTFCLLLVWERGKKDCQSSCVVSSCRGRKTLWRDLSTLWLIDETYGPKQMMDGADWMNRWVLLYDLIICLCSTDKVIPLTKRPRRVLRVRGPFLINLGWFALHTQLLHVCKDSTNCGLNAFHDVLDFCFMQLTGHRHIPADIGCRQGTSWASGQF